LALPPAALWPPCGARPAGGSGGRFAKVCDVLSGRDRSGRRGGVAPRRDHCALSGPGLKAEASGLRPAGRRRHVGRVAPRVGNAAARTTTARPRRRKVAAGWRACIIPARQPSGTAHASAPA
jgi:hypothetical protein